MRKILLAAVLLAAMPTAVLAQQTATVVTAETVAKLSATAAATQQGASPPPNALQQIIAAAPYTLNLEHRIAKAPAAIHQTEAEVMIVLDGAGTLTTGGTLVNAGAARGGNINGDNITGGEARHIVKGDIMIVPESTPHMLVPDSGTALVLATLHVPRDGTSAPGRGSATPKLFNAAADLPAMTARAKAAMPASARFFGGDTILNLAPYHMGLEYRSPKGIASVHKNDGEFMYVLEGEGNIPAGGTVVNPKDSGANIDGDALQGATDHFMKKGDFIYVPAGVPHLAVSDGTFVLATLHVPSPTPVAK
jgi:mannose-6-phosphate isomerase-like protein (cupin superfamily)